MQRSPLTSSPLEVIGMIINELMSFKQPTKEAFNFSRVSKACHEALLYVPSAWNTVIFDAEDRPKSGDVYFGAAKWVLKSAPARYSNILMDISIINISHDYGSAEYECGLVLEILGSSRGRHVDRWRSLVIDVPREQTLINMLRKIDKSYIEPSHRDLPPQLIAELPKSKWTVGSEGQPTNLEDLDLSHRDKSRFSYDSRLEIFPKWTFPNLRRATFRQVNPEWKLLRDQTKETSLQELRLAEVHLLQDPDDFLDFIESSPALHTLAFFDLGSGSKEPMIGRQRSLDSLSRLDISWSSSATHGSVLILKSIAAPTLRELSFHDIGDHHKYGYVHSLDVKSSANAIKLALEGWPSLPTLSHFLLFHAFLDSKSEEVPKLLGDCEKKLKQLTVLEGLLLVDHDHNFENAGRSTNRGSTISSEIRLRRFDA